MDPGHVSSRPAGAGQPPGSPVLTALFVAGWLPFFLALAQVIRLQGAFSDPSRSIAFVPGWTAFAGPASKFGVNWLLLLSLSGTALLLTWGLALECLGARAVASWPRVRWQILGGPAAAWGLLALWGLNTDELIVRHDVWPVALFLHAPTLIARYGIVATGLPSIRSPAVCVLPLVVLAVATIGGQVHFEQPGRNDPEAWVGFGGSVIVGLAVALRLVIWGWAEAPRLEPRVS